MSDTNQEIDSLILFCKKNKKKSPRQLQRDIERAESGILFARERYRKNCEKLAKLKSMMGNYGKYTEPNLKDIESIKNHPDVQSLEISENSIVVITKKIYAVNEVFSYSLKDGAWLPNPKTIKRFLGVYTIRITKNSLRIRNDPELKKEFGLYRANDHPHIYAGKPCFGNIKSFISNMISENKFGIVVDTCIKFLKTTDGGGNPYCPLDHWPIVPDEVSP